MKVLPPKRYQDPFDPRYDPIRHLPWFRKLETRRRHLPALHGAYTEYMKADGEMFWEEAASHYFVTTRELRDYHSFMQNRSRMDELIPEDRKMAQAVIDSAYIEYHDDLPWAACMKNAALLRFMGMPSPKRHAKARTFNEMWEIDPTYLPTGYKL